MVRPEMQKIERPDLPSMGHFVHLNERTKLEMLQARGKSPRLSQSRSRSHMREASYTSASQVDYASSENVGKVEGQTSRITQPEMDSNNLGNTFGI